MPSFINWILGIVLILLCVLGPNGLTMFLYGLVILLTLNLMLDPRRQ